MKKVITAMAGLAMMLTACDYVRGYVKGETLTAEDSSAAKMETIAERDVSITAANAYSNLFLDSTAVENFISLHHINDTTARGLRNFYNRRNFQYAWFSSDGFTEQGRGLWNLYDTYNRTDSANLVTTAVKDLDKRVDTLMEMDTLTVTASDSTFIQTELALTQQYLLLSAQQPALKDSGALFFIPARKVNPMQLADSLLDGNKDSALAAGNTVYTSMKTVLQQYYTIAQNGGWPHIAGRAAALKKGGSAPMIAAIKKRLYATGDLTTADTTAVYNITLDSAVKSFQQRFGIKPDGKITDSLVQVMNVPVQQRIEQLLINMNRMLWAQKSAEPNKIVVNIPDYTLQVYSGDSVSINMLVVVGKQGSNTLMFNGMLNQVVINPYWNIPASIVESDILPAMKTDPNYLKKHNMEVVSKNDSIPTIRQLPGEGNSLGHFKFLFPNSYDIYFHDTPAKELFQNEKRAFSHGCIRLADARKLAEHLLNGNNGWTPEKITAAVNSGKEQAITLQNPVPVSITYYTTWVDANGRVNFREDVYGHDARTRRMLFNSVV